MKNAKVVVKVAVEKVTNALVDAYQLLDLSERLIEELESAPLSELPRLLSFLKKNVRDARKLINDAEAELDKTVRELDEAEVKDLLVDIEVEETRRYEALAREADRAGVVFL